MPDTGTVAEENVELVQRLLLAYQRADFQTALALVDPAARIYPRSEEPGVNEVYVGHEGLFEFLGNWLGQGDDYEAEPISFQEAPADQVLVVMAERGHMKRSKITLDQEFTHSFAVRDDRVTEWRMYDSQEQAQQALGMN